MEVVEGRNLTKPPRYMSEGAYGSEVLIGDVFSRWKFMLT